MSSPVTVISFHSYHAVISAQNIYYVYISNCLFRSTVYKAYSGELPVPSTLNPQADYDGADPDNLPRICQMNISADKPLVDSVFGKVQAGSILSYHHPLPSPEGVSTHMDAHPFPRLRPEDYQLNPTDCHFVSSNQEQLHFTSMKITWSQSNLIE